MESKTAASCRFVDLRLLPVADAPLRSVEAFQREGYAGNPVGYRCVSMIARAVAGLPWLVYVDAVEREDHPLRALLRRPNPAASGTELVEALISHLLIAGDGWLKVSLAGGVPVELHVLHPARMRTVTDEEGWPIAWTYDVAGRTVTLRRGPDDPVPPVMHMRLFSPLSDGEGLSPFAAAARAVDIHNAAARWSQALLENAARPSGALIWRGEGGGALTAEQLERLRAELVDAYAGARNAGRPLVLEGGMDWVPLAHSPRDMEHIELRHAAAREIALAFGVPPMLLGIPGDNTYANFAEANRAFWRQTVLPMARRLAESLTNWLAPAYGEELRLEHDTDDVEALVEERNALWTRLKDCDFLTADEKRAALGYPPLGEGDAAGDVRQR